MVPVSYLSNEKLESNHMTKTKGIDSAKVRKPGKNDECYTPDYGVFPILKYIPESAVVWCPFDTAESEYVKQISKTNRVIHSHLDSGKDFFEYEPDEWDVMISNPPFGGKREIFERALSFNKPFALIMANDWLSDSAPKQLFKDKDLQLLMFEQRIEFKMLNPPIDKKAIPFSSSYFCYNFLPKNIIMERLNIPKKPRKKRVVVEAMAS